MRKDDAVLRRRKRMSRGPHKVPDEIYLSLEMCIDEIMLILKDQGKEFPENRLIGHIIGREFQFMMRDKELEIRREGK